MICHPGTPSSAPLQYYFRMTNHDITRMYMLVARPLLMCRLVISSRFWMRWSNDGRDSCALLSTPEHANLDYLGSWWLIGSKWSAGRDWESDSWLIWRRINDKFLFYYLFIFTFINGEWGPLAVSSNSRTKSNQCTLMIPQQRESPYSDFLSSLIRFLDK